MKLNWADCLPFSDNFYTRNLDRNIWINEDEA